jgi:hypothetical protein
MSKFKHDPEKVAAEQKVQILKEVEELAQYFLYISRDISRQPDPPEQSTIPMVVLFQLLANKTVTTADIINTFAKALRKEVD